DESASGLAGKTPMLARAGSGLYLLAFRTGFTARKFMADGKLPTGAEPRMVVGAILPQVLAAVSGKGVAGVLVDYDFTTNPYREAGLRYERRGGKPCPVGRAPRRWRHGSCAPTRLAVGRRAAGRARGRTDRQVGGRQEQAPARARPPDADDLPSLPRAV